MNSYIYKFTHKITGKFYIGSRCANKVEPCDDFISIYKSSNKYIKTHVDEFIGEIICEIENDPYGHFSWELEQQMIEENWTHPLLINMHYETKRGNFANTKPKETRTYLCVACSKEFTRIEHIHHFKKNIVCCSQRCSSRNAANLTKARFSNPETRDQALQKLNFKKGQTAWNKGMPNPTAAENGRKSAKKLSATVTGRKIQIIDGKRKWVYPERED